MVVNTLLRIKQLKIEPFISRIENALSQNEKCTGGLMAATRVFGIPLGASGAPEVLTLIYADGVFANSFWYGHVVQHPMKSGVFVALLTWTNRFVNAQTVPLLFKRFDHWTRVALEYHPCTVQSEDDAYAECASFDEAVGALETMISRFDHDMRSGYEGSEYASCPSDLRIIDIYGVSNLRDPNGVLPAIPNLRK